MTEQLATLTPGTLVGLVFIIGFLRICVYLAGDIITVSGIQPYLPFSRQRISLTNLRAASTLANTVFLLLGVLAMGIIIFTLFPLTGELL